MTLKIKYKNGNSLEYACYWIHFSEETLFYSRKRRIFGHDAYTTTIDLREANIEKIEVIPDDNA